MSINISNATLRLSKAVTITYDLTKFGPVQRKTFLKALREGVHWGRGAPGVVFENIRKHFNLGHVQINSWGINWKGVDPSTVGQMTTLITASRVSGGHRSPSANYTEKIRSGWTPVYGVDKLPIKKNSYPPLRTTPEFDKFVDAVEKGEITEFTISLI